MTVATLRRRDSRLLLDWTEQAMLQKRAWRKRHTKREEGNGLSKDFARSVAVRTTRTHDAAVHVVPMSTLRHAREGPGVQHPDSAWSVAGRTTRRRRFAAPAVSKPAHQHKREGPTARRLASALRVANRTTRTCNTARSASPKPSHQNGSEVLSAQDPASA